MAESKRIHKPLYRVFHLNPTGGIDWADIIEAIDDEDAIGHVRAMADTHAVELWDRARFVAKVEPPLNALTSEAVVLRGEPEAISTMVGRDAAADAPPAKFVH